MAVIMRYQQAGQPKHRIMARSKLPLLLINLVYRLSTVVPTRREMSPQLMDRVIGPARSENASPLMMT